MKKTVGFTLEAWYFPEWDMWEFSWRRTYYGQWVLAVGLLRFKVGKSEIDR